MNAARNPQDITTLAMAGVFSMRQFRKTPYDAPIYGLSEEDMQSLVEQLFFRAGQSVCLDNACNRHQ